MSIFKKNRIKRAIMPMLQTERLVLRGFETGDAVDLFEYAKSPKVGRMAGWLPHQSIEESRAVIENFIAHGEVWAIVEKKSGHVVGSINLTRDRRRNVDDAMELGYALGESYWGLGYATEACGAALDYAFHTLNCGIISVGHFAFNQKSKRLIKKLGFTYEGTLRHAWLTPEGERIDELIYSLLQTEYETHVASSAKEGGICRH